jgi:hypothetical protein
MLRIFRGDLSLTEIKEMSPRERDFMIQARKKNMEMDKGAAEIDKEMSKLSP